MELNPKENQPLWLAMYFIYNQPFETFIEEGLIKVDQEQMRQICLQTSKLKKWLLGQDSNLQPSGYKNPSISPGLGLSHHPLR